MPQRFNRLRALIGIYARALIDEPRMRSYLAAAFVDDAGVAISVWASQLMMANVFVDQRTRAQFMMPVLLCFIVGSVIAGPLADRSGIGGGDGVAAWRFRVIAWGRGVETAALGLLVVRLWQGGAPTVARVLPYFLIAAFMKTALRPTRIAFEVDLLGKEVPQCDSGGLPRTDEQGRPLFYKSHLLTFTSLISLFNVTAALVGLVVGGKLLALAAGDFWRVYACDVATNLVFLAVFVRGCRPPPEGPGAFAPGRPGSGTVLRSLPAGALLRAFSASLRDAFAFLRRREQRPLLCLLAGGWMVEVANEFYDGKMILKHVLPGTDDDVRYAQIAWSMVALCALACLPALARRVGRLGRIFLVTMLLDGLAIAFAGRSAAVGGAAAILPFTGALAVDRALTETSATLMTLAQNSACQAAMRGRVAAAYAFVVLLSDVVAEGMATETADAIGIPGMLVAVGLAQIALVAGVAAIGGTALWSFGLRTAGPSDPEALRVQTG